MTKTTTGPTTTTDPGLALLARAEEARHLASLAAQQRRRHDIERNRAGLLDLARQHLAEISDDWKSAQVLLHGSDDDLANLYRYDDSDDSDRERAVAEIVLGSQMLALRWVPSRWELHLVQRCPHCGGPHESPELASETLHEVGAWLAALQERCPLGTADEEVTP